MFFASDVENFCHLEMLTGTRLKFLNTTVAASFREVNKKVAIEQKMFHFHEVKMPLFTSVPM